MRKVSPLGFSVTKILAALIVIEAVLFAGGKLATRGRDIVSPPREILNWVVSSGDPPISDAQRGNPRQISVLYMNEDLQPVHFDIAAIQTIDGIRQPQKYMVDSDGRINPNNTRVMQYHKRNAFSISIIYGVDKSVINIHWCQKPGGNPVPMAPDYFGDTMKAILLKRPQYYACDAWVDLRPTTGAEITDRLMQFASTISDRIKAGG